MVIDMSDKRFQKRLAKIRKQGERYKQEKELKDMYAAYAPERKKKKVSNIMLAVSVICIIAYAIGCLAVQYFAGVEVSPTLTTSWFAFFGCELLFLAGIKTSKVIKGNDYDDTDSCG